jgi:hypothetical protein
MRIPSNLKLNNLPDNSIDDPKTVVFLNSPFALESVVSGFRYA